MLLKNLRVKNLTNWVERRLTFLPGTTWPELRVITQRNEAVYIGLSREFGLSTEKTIELLDAAKRAGKHNEFYEAAHILNLR